MFWENFYDLCGKLKSYLAKQKIRLWDSTSIETQVVVFCIILMTKEDTSRHQIHLIFEEFSLHEKCPYSELFCSTFCRIWNRITPNTDSFYALLFCSYWGKFRRELNQKREQKESWKRTIWTILIRKTTIPLIYRSFVIMIIAPTRLLVDLEVCMIPYIFKFKY